MGAAPAGRHTAVRQEVQVLAMNLKYEALTQRERLCTTAAMAQWERSLERPDLSERNRVMGAIEAYQRQSLAVTLMERSIDIENVARSIYEARYPISDQRVDWDKVKPEGKAIWVKCAEAALSAINT